MLSHKKEELFEMHKEKINKRGGPPQDFCERQGTYFCPIFGVHLSSKLEFHLHMRVVAYELSFLDIFLFYFLDI